MIPFRFIKALRAISGALLAAMLIIAMPAAAAGPAGLDARPSADVAATLPPGFSALPHRAVAYRPQALPDGPAPLLVLVHGYPGQADDFIRNFTRVADRRGLVLVALQSRERRWDLVPEPQDNRGPLRFKLRADHRFGKDVPRIDAALKDLFGRMAIDPARVAILGFSDGASYALSLGIANPRLFPFVIALSPGFVVLPDTLLASQSLFVASGTRDTMLPYVVVERDIVPLLRKVGFTVHFASFDGPHVIAPALLEQALDLAFGSTPR